MASRAAGIAAGGVQTSCTYADNAGMASGKEGSTGHGFAAEMVNHYTDYFFGKESTIVGTDNKKNGPDRAVNGEFLQSKYCATGTKSVQAMFDKKGQYMYTLESGSPMPVEVPSDQYNEAVGAMEKKIREGKVAGVTDVAVAKDLVRKGHVTYAQAKNICKAGTIEGLVFDSANGVVSGAFAGSISATIAFGYSVWKGDDVKTAAGNAVSAMVEVGGISFLTSVATSQVGKTSVRKMLYPTAQALVKKMPTKTMQMVVNGISTSAAKPIYGAAAQNSAAKLLSGNVVVNTVTVGVLTLVDTDSLVRDKMSKSQFMKNFPKTAANVVGGAAGWACGAAVSVAAFPTFAPAAVVGGLLFSVAGSSLAGTAISGFLDTVWETPEEMLTALLEQEISSHTYDYMLTPEDVEGVIAELAKADVIQDVRRQLSSVTDSEKSSEAKILIESHVEGKVKGVLSDRKKVSLEEWEEALRSVVEQE